MESAGSHAYVSKNFLAKYQQKKAAKTEQVLEAKSMPKPLVQRRRSRSRSNSGSDEENERCRSIEMVHSDELEGAINLSDCEDNSHVQEFRGQKAKRKKAPARIFKQEVDTNVFNISMGTLKTDGELATGDPIFCKSCGAAFNIHSKIYNGKTPSQSTDMIIDSSSKQQD